MPYFPPEIPPPPIVMTWPTPSASASAANNQDEASEKDGQGSEEQAAVSWEPLAIAQPDPVTLAAEPASTQAIRDVEAIDTHRDHVIDSSETQAIFLQEIVPSPQLPADAVGASLNRDESRAIAPPEDSSATFDLASPWVAQAEERPAESVPDDVLLEEAVESAEEEPTETPSPFPRAASPEPFWSNGAVVEGEVLLPPSQPTNRPPIPLNLTADYQEFEPNRQILTARGDVVLRLSNGILSADRLWANLANRYVLVEGNVVFARGEQVVEAERGEYNLIQGEGSLFDARGTLFLPGLATDFGDITINEITTPGGVLANDPISGVRNTGSIVLGTGIADEGAEAGSSDAGGSIRRIRFEAAQLDFDAEGWYAQDIRLTNDPFSPPELEFRGDSARLTRLTEFQDELYVENARLVFDQSFTVPLFRDRILLSRGGPDGANPLFVTFGYDGEDRDGLFIERSFPLVTSRQWQVFLTPQILVQRFASEEEEGFLSNFGLEADLSGALGPRTTVEANASFSGLDVNNLEERLRANIRVRQALGDHSLNLEYTYRDRLYNGSLGFQDVQSSLGVVLLSPNIVLGDTGIVLTYQASAQYITADSDRPELIDPPPFRELVSLGRFQGSVALVKSFLLWQGTPLPPTRDEGLRFTAVPRVPNVQLVLGGRGTYTYYTNDDVQQRVSGTIGIVGELGNFSDDFFDSTVFNLSYERAFVGEDSQSPFLFDRDVDQNVLRGGIIQQIYGPFRLGFQTAINLDTGEVIDTDYLLEYNRRTYGIFLRYSPTQSAGFLGFRLNEFDWAGRAPRFGGAAIRQVDGGVVR